MDSSEAPLEGSCLCGEVTYHVVGSPVLMYHCHCGMCRKATGASFATNVVIRLIDFTINAGADNLSSFESSPGKRRYFCARCGSPIYSHSRESKDIVSLRCGTLDTDPRVRPTVHAYVDSKAPWTVLHDDLEKKAAAIR